MMVPQRGAHGARQNAVPLFGLVPEFRSVPSIGARGCPGWRTSPEDLPLFFALTSPRLIARIPCASLSGRRQDHTARHRPSWRRGVPPTGCPA